MTKIAITAMTRSRTRRWEAISHAIPIIPCWALVSLLRGTEEVLQYCSVVVVEKNPVWTWGDQGRP